MTSFSVQKIVVAIDESDVSNVAFTAATSFAKALSTKLMIVHVLNPHDPHSPQLYSSVGDFTGQASVELDERMRQQYEREWTAYVEHCEALLKQKTDEAIAAGIEADCIHPSGMVGSTLCEVARVADASLLVVGSHQRRGIAEIMLGSTSNYVTHHAPCSVLVVHPDGNHHKSADKSFSQTENMTAGAV